MSPVDLCYLGAIETDRSDVSPKAVLAFGPFQLDPVQHVLRKSGQPLRLGGRALEILLALLARPGAAGR
jgi:DNA-binding winged helix-turn-helix (wHTH) protein